MSQYIVNPSSKTCFCLTLIHYGKPVISVYILDLTGWFLQEIAYSSLVRVCLVISVNREKLLRLVVTMSEEI